MTDFDSPARGAVRGVANDTPFFSNLGSKRYWKNYKDSFYRCLRKDHVVTQIERIVEVVLNKKLTSHMNHVNRQLAQLRKDQSTEVNRAVNDRLSSITQSEVRDKVLVHARQVVGEIVNGPANQLVVTSYLDASNARLRNNLAEWDRQFASHAAKHEAQINRVDDVNSKLNLMGFCGVLAVGTLAYIQSQK